MHHKISGDNNNKNIVVHKGDTIEIQLDETPTTGYSWEIDKVDSQILGFQSSDYKIYDTAGNRRWGNSQYEIPGQWRG